MILDRTKNNYGSSYDGYSVWFFPKGTSTRCTCISNNKSGEIIFDYDVPANTYNESSAVLITKEEFVARLNVIKDKIKLLNKQLR